MSIHKTDRKAWTAEEESLLAKLYADHTCFEVFEGFRKAGYKRTRKAIASKIEGLGLKKTEEGLRKTYEDRKHRPSDVAILDKLDWLPTFDKFETIRANRVAICSDMQIPYIDVDLVKKMCLMAGRMEAKHCIIAGDTFNQDMFSSFIRYLEDGMETWTFELDVASEILKMLLGSFEQLWIFRGNHDERILRLLMGKVGLKHIFKWVTDQVEKRVHVSEYPYCYVISSGRKIRVTHPASYSKIPGRVSSWLATKWQCSVMSAHGHQLALVPSISGHWVADLGGMFDDKKIEYVNLRDTTHNRWSAGFFIIRDGFPFMFSRDWTDWNYWMK